MTDLGLVDMFLGVASSVQPPFEVACILQACSICLPEAEISNVVWRKTIHIGALQRFIRLETYHTYRGKPHDK